MENEGYGIEYGVVGEGVFVRGRRWNRRASEGSGARRRVEAPGPGPDLDRRGPRARGLGPFKNLPIQELAHEGTCP